MDLSRMDACTQVEISLQKARSSAEAAFRQISRFLADTCVRNAAELADLICLVST